LDAVDEFVEKHHLVAVGDLNAQSELRWRRLKTQNELRLPRTRLPSYLQLAGRFEEEAAVEVQTAGRQVGPVATLDGSPADRAYREKG
jgi:hypothetical protein